MATIDMTSGTSTRLRQDSYSARTILVEKVVDFAAAVTAKGSALAAADVLEVIDLPAGTLLLAAGFEVVTEMTGTATDLALDLGITGGNVDGFVDGFDYDGASVGDYSTLIGYYTAQTGPILVGATADTLDILIQAQTGTFTGGELRVWALVTDVSGRDRPGIATAGS